jgi:hypothetical protein
MRLPHILLLCAVTVSAAGRQVAITIDDLPRGGDLGPTDLASIRAMTEQLLRSFRKQKIPVIGFVNEGRIMPSDDGTTPSGHFWQERDWCRRTRKLSIFRPAKMALRANLHNISPERK